MAEKKIESFIMYCNWEGSFAELPEEDQAKLIMAIFAYINRNEIPDLPKGSGVSLAFRLMKDAIDNNRQKYEEKCEINRQNAQKSRKRTLANASDRNRTLANASEATFSLANKSVGIPNDNDNDKIMNMIYDYDNEDDNDIALTENERNALVGLSSVESVEKYISKIIDWQKASGKRMKNPYMTIKGWIDEDVKSGNLPGETKKESNYDLDEFERYAMTSGFGGGKNKP